jgi:hypothetical protein
MHRFLILQVVNKKEQKIKRLQWDVETPEP